MGDNDDVQLQVIRALQVAVASENSEVHDSRLLLAVRTCYLIHLTSRNSVNQATAKGALNQVLTTVFDRIENEALVVAEQEQQEQEAREAAEPGSPQQSSPEGSP